MGIAVGMTRVVMGVYFVLSGMASYVAIETFREVVKGKSLELLGLDLFQLPPLPESVAVPFAYVIPGLQILAGTLFAMGLWVKWTGIAMILMLLTVINDILHAVPVPGARAGRRFDRDYAAAAR